MGWSNPRCCRPDPVDNMIAAFRCAISRYGSMNNIPGVVAVRQGGSCVGY